MASGEIDGIPYVAIGNSEPIPTWLTEKDEFAELLVVIRKGRRNAGWCDHGFRLKGAPILPRGQERALCPAGCE